MEEKIVDFKSVPENYEKERSGLKPNTVRILLFSDPRFYLLDQRTATHVRITNTVSGESFKRKITDITFWNGEFIISWEHCCATLQEANEAWEEVGT